MLVNFFCSDEFDPKALILHSPTQSPHSVAPSVTSCHLGLELFNFHFCVFLILGEKINSSSVVWIKSRIFLDYHRTGCVD